MVAGGDFALVRGSNRFKWAMAHNVNCRFGSATGVIVPPSALVAAASLGSLLAAAENHSIKASLAVRASPVVHVVVLS